MQFEHITSDEGLQAFCREVAACPSLAIDTEFISENSFRPELCLLQVAAAGRLALIDPLPIHDLSPFWQLLCTEGRETVVHAGRSEAEFCLAAVGQPPAGMFDVQLAAGLVGFEYPSGYGALITKVLGRSAPKHETRTDWRRRPLAQRQIHYALEDVEFLHPIRDALHARLRELGRLEWFVEEMAAWQAQLIAATSEERWRRVSGAAGLDPRSQAVVRELYAWREGEAQHRDQPARRVLRDDLIVELARRQTADPKRIRAVRGLERGDLQKRMPAIVACITRALELPDELCPARLPRERTPELSVLGQLLFAALGSVCRQAHLAPNLVGTPNDIRELIAHGSGPRDGHPLPKLARGWRKQFVGDLFEDLLSGATAIRVANPHADAPLAFEQSKR